MIIPPEVCGDAAKAWYGGRSTDIRRHMKVLANSDREFERVGAAWGLRMCPAAKMARPADRLASALQITSEPMSSSEAAYRGRCWKLPKLTEVA